LDSIIRPISIRVQQSIRRERSGSTVTYRMTSVGEFSPYLSVVVGDVIHNLRSALDHLAWQLVLLDGGQPTDSTQFPIYASATNAKGNPRNVTIQPGIHDQHIIDALIKVQPFTEAKYGHDPASDPLWIIHRLNIIDKHRLLVTIAHTIDHDLPAWWGSNEGDPTPRYTIHTGPLHDGDAVMTFDFGEVPLPQGFHAEVKVVMSIWEPEASWVSGLAVDNGLDRLVRAVQSTINLDFLPLWNDRSVQPLYVP
jgi:hypothetical protein